MVTHRRDNLHRFKKIYKFENKILVDVTNSYKLAKKQYIMFLIKLIKNLTNG